MLTPSTSCDGDSERPFRGSDAGIGGRQQWLGNADLLDALAAQPRKIARPVIPGQIGEGALQIGALEVNGVQVAGDARTQPCHDRFVEPGDEAGRSRPDRTAAGGSGPLSFSNVSQFLPVKTADALVEANARRQQIPSIRHARLFSDARPVRRCRVLPADPGQRRPIAQEDSRAVALMFAEQVGLLRVETAEVKKRQRLAVDEVLSVAPASGRASADSSTRRCRSDPSG